MKNIFYSVIYTAVFLILLFMTESCKKDKISVQRTTTDTTDTIPIIPIDTTLYCDSTSFYVRVHKTSNNCIKTNEGDTSCESYSLQFQASATKNMANFYRYSLELFQDGQWSFIENQKYFSPYENYKNTFNIRPQLKLTLQHSCNGNEWNTFYQNNFVFLDTPAYTIDTICDGQFVYTDLSIIDKRCTDTLGSTDCKAQIYYGAYMETQDFEQDIIRRAFYKNILYKKQGNVYTILFASLPILFNEDKSSYNESFYITQDGVFKIQHFLSCDGIDWNILKEDNFEVKF